MPDKIHSILHIGPQRDHLLIVFSQYQENWLFRLVNSQGQIIQEEKGFPTAIAAEEAGKRWFTTFVLDKP